MEMSEIILDQECEYRFEVGAHQQLSIRLKSGSAEIFGVELAINKEYNFCDQKLAVFTWYGCILETKGETDVSYVSDETPMTSYMNLHTQLQLLREQCMKIRKRGPRVLITGPVDSGKSSLSQILLNYALRLGEKPTFVELDIGLGALSLPGTITATPLDSTCLSVEEPFILTNPLSYFYGHASLGENPEYFRFLIQRLSAAVKCRMESDTAVNTAGILLNTCGWVDGLGYEMLLSCVQTFDIDVVLVIGQDRLYSRLSKSLDNSFSIIKLARSGGVVPLNSKLRSSKRMSKIREYFYGRSMRNNSTFDLSPCVVEVDFEAVNIFAVKDMNVSDAMLPVGQSDQVDRLRVVPISVTSDLTHSILAVCHVREATNNDCSDTDQSFLLGSAVAGFVCVKEIRESDKKLILLVPSPGPLPSRYLQLGSIKWIE